MKNIKKFLILLLLTLSLSTLSLFFISCDKGIDDPTNNCVHEFSEWGDSTATCTANGTEKRTCSLCDFEEKRPVAKLSHSFTNYVEDNNADCITKATETATCDYGCGATDSNVIGEENPLIHNNNEYTYAINELDSTKHDKIHSCCGVVYETISHEFENYTSNNDATCSLDGTKTGECVCGKTHTIADEGTATGEHETYIAQRVHNDCTSDGKNIIKCRTCDDYHDEQKTTSKTGHTITSWKIKSQTLVSGQTCVYEVKYEGYCSVCNKEDAEIKTENETVHAYSCNITTVANCNHQGVKTYTCIHGCQNSTKTENYEDKENHAWEKDGEAVNGVQAYRCANGCGKTKNVIEATSNSHILQKSELSTNELKLSNQDVSVALQLDSVTLNLLNDGEVKLSAEILSETERQSAIASLTEAQKTLLGNKQIYDFTMTQNSTTVSNFNGGKIRVAIDYTPEEGEDTNNLVIWHLSSTGIEVFSATYVNGQAVFYATHFSNFVVASVSNEDACLANGHEYVYGNVVEATCVTGGYTEATCAHCGKAVIANVTNELGHDYNVTPTETPKTCTTDGKYTYSCKRVGCTHTQEIPIPASHSYVTQEYVYPTCCADGYKVEKCSVCHNEKRTELEKVNYHDMKVVYELLEGTSSCVDGLVRYEICREEGCGFKTAYEHINEHLSVYKFSGVEDFPEYNQEIFESMDLKELLPEHYEYAYAQDYEGIIKIYKSTCLCGEICGQVEFNDSTVFNGANFYINEGDVWGTVEQEFYSQPIYVGMGTSNLDTYILKFVVEEEANGCDREYILKVTLKSEDGTDTLIDKSYVLLEGVTHQSEVTEYTMLTPNTKCCDGVKETVKCADCGEILREQVLSSENAHLHYTYIEESISLSAYGNQGHICNIVISSCPCGDKIDFKIKPTSGLNRCSFTQTAIDDITTEYVCACGIRYVRRFDDYKDENCYKTYKTTLLYNYDAQSGEYLSSVVGYLSDFGYYHRWSDSEFEQIGDSCYYSWTQECLDCGKPSSGITSRHQTENTVTVDANGNKTTKSGCVNCDYHSLRVEHFSGNLIREYAVVYEYDQNIKTVWTKTYTLIERTYDGEKYYYSIPSFETQYVYDMETGEITYWEKTMYILKQNEGKAPCVLIEFATDSNGEAITFENSCCFHMIDVYEESTCTKAGRSGQLCVICGGLNGYEMGPQHIMICGEQDGLYRCDRCGFTHNEDAYNHSVLIELLEDTDQEALIGYYNKYDFEPSTISGTTSILLLIQDTEGEREEYLEGDFISDDGNVITIDKEEMNEAISAIGLLNGTEYKVMFEVLTNYGNVLRIELS